MTCRSLGADRSNTASAIIIVLILELSGSTLLLGSQGAPAAATQPAPKTAAATAAPKSAAPATPVDGGWPRAYTTTSGAGVLLYQPQILTWAEQKHVTAYAAVSYAAKGAQAPALGTIKVEADTSVAVDDRLVNFTKLTIAEATFPTIPKEQVRTVIAEITAGLPTEQRVIALDRVLANIDTSQIIPRNVDGVKADPPAMFFSSKPAMLVIFDGDPVWSPIQGNDLRFAVNTNWDVFEHAPTKSFFLRVNDAWMKAAAVAGPWSPAGTLPDSFTKLPNDPNWKDVKAALPGKKLSGSQAPTIFVSMKPAEMILLTGAPSYLLVPGTSLLWVNNTESDVFRAGKDGPVFFLVSGRWFSAPDFTGPWTFATPTLPADFKKIPIEHPRSRVLAAVPGTSQAIEAVMLAQVPQTATVKRKEIKAPEVEYQGAPKFEPIEKTTMATAVNTDKDIIKVGDLYYMCFQGVWFMAKAATGPWEVTSSVPKEIYEIPVSSPVHNVTYVTVESSTSDEVVFATAAAYSGMMIAFGCAVWGTGYYYPPYYGYGGMYPYYYPRYPTYGYGASYNPWTGAYTRGVVAYGPYGGAGAAARYNPRTGTYSRGAVAYGPYGARGAASAYNPRTGAVGATRQGSNVYGSWGSSAVARGDQWAATSRVTNNAGVTTRRTETSNGSSARVTGPGGNSAAVAKGNNGDLYAGHDGNVYKKSGDSWQKANGSGGWDSVQPTAEQRQQAQTRAQDRAGTTGATSSTVGQLNRDSSARTQGTTRTNTYSGGASRSSAGARSYGGSSGGGGARRSGGGGGRRR